VVANASPHTSTYPFPRVRKPRELRVVQGQVDGHWRRLACRGECSRYARRGLRELVQSDRRVCHPAHGQHRRNSSIEGRAQCHGRRVAAVTAEQREGGRGAKQLVVGRRDQQLIVVEREQRIARRPVVAEPPYIDAPNAAVKLRLRGHVVDEGRKI
jgi:hypothetical protein